MPLLAETTVAFDWPSILLAYGPLGVFSGVVLYFVMTYGPRLLEGHVSFMTLCRETHAQQQDYNRRLTDSLDTLTETAQAQREDHKKTHRAISHMAEAGKVAISGPTAQDIHRHLDRAIDELSR